MKKTFVAFCVLLCTLATGVHAAPAGPMAAKAARQAPQGVDDTLKEGIQKLIGFINQARAKGGASNPQAMLAFLNREIGPYFDFDYMAHYAAGGYWRRMNPQQRARLANRIRTEFFTTLAGNLSNYQSQRIRYFAPRSSANGKEVDLNVWVMQRGSGPIKLKFRLYKGAGGWKVFDVAANNNSAVMHYRRQVRQFLR
ncbi:MAG: ABC transporter substrate-binding protein [Chromatiales bacterium]|nr:ABC transporter substrate-binding protein [Chromatiales bacterium]